MIKYYNKYGEELRFQNFIELQWNRKYHECGSFELYMSVKDYNPEDVYIENVGCPELGIIQKVHEEEKPEGTFVTLTGYFIEKLLDLSMMWQGISNGNQYPSYRGAIKVLLALGFTQFNNALSNQMKATADNCYVTYNDWVSLPAHIVNSCLMQTTVDEKGSYMANPPFINVQQGVGLGKLFFDLFEEGGYSYYCEPVFNVKANEGKQPLLGLNIVGTKGRDLTSKVFFGKAFKNIKKLDYTFDESAIRSDYLAVQVVSDDSKFSNQYAVYKDSKWQKTIVERVKNDVNVPGNLGYCRPFKVLYTTVSSDTTAAALESEIRSQMHQQITLDMLNNYKVENISVDVIQNRFLYKEDYDLGDVCTIIDDELQQRYTARIVEIYEVHSKNKVDIQVVLGTPTKQKYRRVY